MRNLMLGTLAALLTAGTASSQVDDLPSSSLTVFGQVNQSLASGAVAIRDGNYDDGIRLTLMGLEDKTLSDRDRAAGLSNLCAAYAAKELPDTAIRYCTESLAITSDNWRAFSNRSYAYWLKGLYSEAVFDLDAAAAISPKARQVAQIRGMINESRFTPNIVMEDLQ